MLVRWARTRIHVSWMVAIVCAAIVAGVILARQVSVGQFGSIAWFLTGVALILMSLRQSRLLFIGVAVIGGALLGLWRGSIVLSDLTEYETYVGSSVVLSGVISEDGDTNKRGQTVLRLKDIKINNQAAAGTVWMTTSDKVNVTRSDRITANGKLSEGFGSFAASLYSANVLSVSQPVPGDMAIKVRDWFGDGVRRAVSEPESSLGLGYLVGQRRGLPEELDTALQTAGLTHIVVASGYNLTILVRFARRLFEKVSKYLALLASSGMIASFVAITGLSPSMSRAGLVAGLSLAAWYYGRRFHPLVLLPFAASITVLVQPSFAWGDLGWQLSFAAFGGVMIMAPLIQAYFFGDKPEKPVRRIFIETIAAQLWTLPILLVSFGQISVIAPIANMLILPLVPLAMLLTFVAGVWGLFVPAAAEIGGIPADMILTYMTTTAQYMGNIPWAIQELKVGMLISTLMYVVIVGFCVYAWRATRLQLERTSLIE